jgi:hypothetical protein
VVLRAVQEVESKQNHDAAAIHIILARGSTESFVKHDNATGRTSDRVSSRNHVLATDLARYATSAQWPAHLAGNRVEELREDGMPPSGERLLQVVRGSFDPIAY